MNFLLRDLGLVSPGCLGSSLMTSNISLIIQPSEFFSARGLECYKLVHQEVLPLSVSVSL